MNKSNPSRSLVTTVEQAAKLGRGPGFARGNNQGGPGGPRGGAPNRDAKGWPIADASAIDPDRVAPVQVKAPPAKSEPEASPPDAATPDAPKSS